LGIQYLNYGSFTETDNIGNTNGTYTGIDFCLTAGASRSYGEHWRYGANLKLAQSSLGPLTGNALLTDIGVNYYDTARLLDIGIVAKNMGGHDAEVQLRRQPNEPLPFDLQLGASIRLKHVPLTAVSPPYTTCMSGMYGITIRHWQPLHRLSTTDSMLLKKGRTLQINCFRHFIFRCRVCSWVKRIVITGSYNFP
jgi:hypothetical protein